MFKTISTLRGISSFELNNSNSGVTKLGMEYSGIGVENLFPIVSNIRIGKGHRGYNLDYNIKNMGSYIQLDILNSRFYYDKLIEDYYFKPSGMSTVSVTSIVSNSSNSADISFVDFYISSWNYKSLTVYLYDNSNNSLLDSVTLTNTPSGRINMKLIISKKGVKRVKITFKSTNQANVTANEVTLSPTRDHYVGAQINAMTYKTISDFNSQNIPYSINFLCFR